jgi:hypothetical protein
MSIAKAESIWEKPFSKELFMYSERGKLTINLIYDERQATTEKRAILEADTKKVKNLATGVKQEYYLLKNDLAAKQVAYEEMLSTYQVKQKTYNNTVTSWNNKGGAPPETYAQLVEEERNLATEFQVLESKRIEVNSLISQLNNFSDNYNILVENVNQNIEQFNQESGKEFQEGIYDPNSKSISIFEFSAEEKLVRVLAHEFGHALSLDHNTNPKSIMYALNEADTLVLSEEDTASLKKRCEVFGSKVNLFNL